MLDALVRRVMVVAQAGADTGNLVRRYRSADATAANHNAPLSFAIANGQTDGLGKIRVIHRFAAVGS
jgi:hypothetical protein